MHALELGRTNTFSSLHHCREPPVRLPGLAANAPSLSPLMAPVRSGERQPTKLAAAQRHRVPAALSPSVWMSQNSKINVPRVHLLHIAVSDLPVHQQLIEELLKSANMGRCCACCFEDRLSLVVGTWGRLQGTCGLQAALEELQPRVGHCRARICHASRVAIPTKTSLCALHTKGK